MFEKKFPDKCDRYIIASNCGFWQKFNNTSNLVYCIKSIINNNKRLLSNNGFLKQLDRLIELTASDKDLVFNVLRKVKPIKSFDLDSYEVDLIKKIVNITNSGDQRYDFLKKGAMILLNRMLKASSKVYNTTLHTYFMLQDNPEQMKDNEIIKNKCITKEIVQNIINQSLSPDVTLKSYMPIILSELPKGMQKMELKMAKGGISIQNIDLAKDHKSSIEYLLAKWHYKYKSQETKDRYQHLRTIVRTECQESFDYNKIEDGIFGINMLINTRERLRHRYNTEIAGLYKDCYYEHLLGIAGMLTEECTIWWSEPFEILNEVTL